MLPSFYEFPSLFWQEVQYFHNTPWTRWGLILGFITVCPYSRVLFLLQRFGLSGILDKSLDVHNISPFWTPISAIILWLLVSFFHSPLHGSCSVLGLKGSHPVNMHPRPQLSFHRKPHTDFCSPPPPISRYSLPSCNLPCKFLLLQKPQIRPLPSHLSK